MRQPLAIVTLSLLLVAPFPGVAAAPNYHDLHLASGENWAAIEFATPLKCLGVTFHTNFTAPSDSWQMAFWMKSPNEWLSGFAWAEGSSFRVVVDSSVTGRMQFGGDPYTGVTGARISVPEQCTLFAGGWTHMAFALPVNNDVHARLASSTGAIGGTWTTGSDAFMADARDFSGTFAEAEFYFTGASAVVDMSFTRTVPPGMLAYYTSTATTGWLEVTGPNGFRDSAYCSGGNINVGLTCSQTTAFRFAHVGDGVAPGGSYTFRLSESASAEAVHIFLVAAPVNW